MSKRRTEAGSAGSSSGDMLPKVSRFLMRRKLIQVTASMTAVALCLRANGRPIGEAYTEVQLRASDSLLIGDVRWWSGKPAVL